MTNFELSPSVIYPRIHFNENGRFSDVEWLIADSIKEWCNEHMPGRWYLQSIDAGRLIRINFVYERDAVLFCLRWDEALVS